MLRSFASVALVVLALLTGCANAPRPAAAEGPRRVVVEPRTADVAVGAAIAERALQLIGAPYRYGGDDPSAGFDCSGLVFYTYGQAGYTVPRNSREQFRAARKIALDDAAPGDVVFFQDELKLSHVGIYLGDGRFVHAPASGRRVAIGSLDTSHYQQALVGVGRLLEN
jgi:cell wall-associated NlpC family hydrolase